MKMLKKLALVTAVSMISAGAFAMEAMDDESMASATGQDGITILVKPGVITNASLDVVTGRNVSQATRDLIDNPSAGYYANNDNEFAGLTIGTIVVHDDDGLGATGLTGNSGALVIGGGLGAVTALKDSTVLLADGSSPIKIDIDMVGDIDGAGAGGAMLNVKISTPRLAIKTGDIYVANSNSAQAGRLADGTASAPALEVDGTTHSDKIKIMSGLELVIGEASTTIQLGSESQGHMVVANTTLVGGLTINNLEVFDAGGVLNPTLGTVVTTGGSFFASSLSIKDAGGTNLSVISNVDIGSANSTAFDAGQSATVTTNITPKVQQAVVTAAAIPGITTYAQLQAAAFGLNGLDDGGAGDDNAVAYGGLTTVNTNVAASLPGAVSGVQSATQAAYNGLVIEMVQFGHATNGADLAINNIRIGDSTAATLGDVQILGLNINGTVAVISGH